jgi:hypothetical protein
MRGLKIVLTSFCLTGLVACAQPGSIDEINDPHEGQNRKMHELNKTVDQAVLKPVAQAYSDVVPDPVEDAVSNFANNLGMPSNVLNHLAQGEVGIPQWDWVVWSMLRAGMVNMRMPQISAKHWPNGVWAKGPMSSFRYWVLLRNARPLARYWIA